MKWVLIYIIMTTTHGSASISIEYETEKGCEWGKSFINLSMLTEKPRDAIVVVECFPKAER